MPKRLRKMKVTWKKLSLFKQAVQNTKVVVLFISLFAVIGIVLLISSRAATPFVSVEPELGVLTAPATSANDTFASGGKYLQFGTSSSPQSLTQTGISNFRTGAVLTQWSLDPFGNATAIANGKTLLKNSTYAAQQPWVGFGVDVPSTGPNTYTWGGLDKRIGPTGVTSSAGIPEVTLNINAVPGWMRNEPDFGTAPDGSTYIGHPPLPQYYDGIGGDDIGDQVAAAVLHYPNVKYVTVWSEMRGLFLSSQNRWDYQRYTAIYNNIWDKVKAARPDIKIGGPYPSITSSSKSGRNYNSTEITCGSTSCPWGWIDQRDLDVIKYWLPNKHGADFLIYDIRNHHDYDDRAQGVPELVDRFHQNDKFIDMFNWVRGLNNTTYPGATTLPIWANEWYSRWNTPDPTLAIADQTDQGTLEQRSAVMADGLMKMVKSGIQRAFLWGPQGEANTPGWMHPLGLFTDTRVSGGGQATLFYPVQKMINDNFSEGTQLYSVSNTNNLVSTLASATKIMLVNTSDTAQTTTVQGMNVSLAAYEVKLIDMLPAPPSLGSGISTNTISVPVAGTYKVWTRLKSPDTTNNSYSLQVDSSPAITVGDSASAPTGTWIWVDYKGGVTTDKIEISLTAGTHTLKLIGREDSVKVDRVLLLSSTDTCKPTGTGDNCTPVADTTPPTTAITSPVDGAVATGAVNITANAADDVAISKVEFLIDNVVNGTGTAQPYTYSWDTTSVQNGSHVLTSRAYDTTNNVTTSLPVTVSVLNDKAAPSAPTNLAVAAASSTKVSLSWSASTDDIGVTGYSIIRSVSGGAPEVLARVGTVTSYDDITVAPSTNYTYTVTAFDAVNNTSQPSNSVNTTTPAPPDTVPPSTVTLSGSATAYGASLNWTPATDDVGVTKYYVYRGFLVIAEVTGTSYLDTTATVGATYSYNVRAADAAGNVGIASNVVQIIMPGAPDTIPPTTPGNLTLTNPTSHQINLYWLASTDNVGIKAYVIYRNNSVYAITVNTSWSDGTIDPNGTYTYKVLAKDTSGNNSPFSNEVTKYANGNRQK